MLLSVVGKSNIGTDWANFCEISLTVVEKLNIGTDWANFCEMSLSVVGKSNIGTDWANFCEMSLSVVESQILAQIGQIFVKCNRFCSIVTLGLGRPRINVLMPIGQKMKVYRLGKP